MGVLSSSDKIAAQRGIRSRDAIELAGPHVAGRHHQVALLTAAIASSGEI